MPTPVTAMAGAGWEVGRTAAMLDSRGENAGVWRPQHRVKALIET